MIDLIILLCFCLVSIEAQNSIKTDTGQEFKISYDKAKQMMKFEAKVGKEGWFGIGFGKTMRNSDMIIFRQGTVTDSWSTGYSAPKADKEQHLEDVEVSEDGDYQRYVAYRKLQTGDKQDYQAVLDTDVEMMWAERRSGKYFGRHTKYNWFTAKLIEELSEEDDVQIIQEPYVHVETKAEIWFKHGVIMTIAWFPLAFLSIATNRWGAVFWRKRQILHSLAGYIATILTLLSGIGALNQKIGLFGTEHPSYWFHNYTGFLITIFVIILTALGMAAMIFRKTSVWNSKTMKIVSKIHKVMSSVLIFASMTAIVSGWYKYSAKYAPEEQKDQSFFMRQLGAILITVELLIIVIMEIWFRKMRAEKDEFVKPTVSMTEAEFEEKIKNGEELWIMDDLVLDLKDFTRWHPGGEFTLKYTVGRDVSKYFYGSYALDHNSSNPAASELSVPKWTHTNIARKIVNELAVARLVKEPTPHFIANVDHSQSYAITSNTKSFVFQSKAIVAGIKSYYPDLGMLGKHYLLCDSTFRHKTKIIHRHYTIANCMRKDFYEAITKAVQESSESNKDALKHILNSDDKSDLSLTIKNYNVMKGLATRITNPTNSDVQFEIQGPMGKGLGLTHESAGDYYAFAAGTGVLVFIDLVARIALSQIGIVDGPEKLNPDCKFTLFVSYANRKEAIALTLLEELAKMCPNQFELRLRISEEKMPRWTDEFINKSVRAAKDLKRIWVCGPPMMNEQFDKALFTISPLIGMDFKTQVDIM